MGARVDFTLRPAECSADAGTILEALRDMHREVGQAPLNAEKAVANIKATARGGYARLVELGDFVVGTYGLVRSSWWYSDDEALFSQWFYVKKNFRYGVATRMLLEDVSDLVEDEGVPAFVHVFTPPGGGHGRSPCSVRRVAEELGFLPTGRLLIFEPRGNG